MACGMCAPLCPFKTTEVVPIIIIRSTFFLDLEVGLVMLARVFDGTRYEYCIVQKEVSYSGITHQGGGALTITYSS